MVHSARRVSHLGERVHRPKPHEWTARRWVRRFKFRNRREVSAGSAQLLEEDWSQGGGRSHTQSALPSAPESVGYHGRSKFEFQRPGRRACARVGGTGRAALVPAPDLGHVVRPSSGWSGAVRLLSPRLGWRRFCLRNCLGRAPCCHARTHACPSRSFPGSVSSRRPAFFLGGPYEPRPALWPLGLM